MIRIRTDARMQKKCWTTKPVKIMPCSASSGRKIAKLLQQRTSQQWGKKELGYDRSMLKNGNDKMYEHIKFQWVWFACWFHSITMRIRFEYQVCSSMARANAKRKTTACYVVSICKEMKTDVAAINHFGYDRWHVCRVESKALTKTLIFTHWGQQSANGICFF